MKGRFTDVFLIGDTGEPGPGSDHVFSSLKNQLPKDDNSWLIFLGDNIYPNGLPEKGHISRRKSEQILLSQFNIFKDFPGKVFFLSGNHDWNKGRPDGWEAILRQEEFIRKETSGHAEMLPHGGLPGPAMIDAGDHLKIIALNTHWWLHKGPKPGDVETENRFYSELEDELKKIGDKRILVVGHLPIFSDGMHGGKYTMKHHLFPFTIYNKKAYFPLPVIGSALPVYRKYFGAKEDVSHPLYQRFIKKLNALFSRYPGIIYAAGHEHNLQYIFRGGIHYIVSGSGSRTKYVYPGRHAVYAKSTLGYVRLRIYEDNEAELEFIEVSRTGTTSSSFHRII